MKNNKYEFIYEEYGEKMKNSIGDIIFVSKKWNDADLVWPFSDLDIRIILEKKKYDFFEINEKIFEVHKRIEKQNKINQRILEHTPGYVFLENELFNHRVEDVNNWSFCYGDISKFKKLKDYYKRFNKANKNNDYYKRIIIKRYKKFSFDNEFNQYKNEEHDKYMIYCIVWHYYFPCIYAIYSINDNKVKNRKIDENFIKNDMILSIYKKIKDGSISNKDYNINDLIKIVDKEISQELIKNNIKLIIEKSDDTNILEAISMLRTRICRYKLYLDDTLTFDRNYLINREINELRFIINEINNKAKNTKVEELLKYINEEDKEPRDILEYSLQYFYNNKEIFNNIMNGIY